MTEISDTKRRLIMMLTIILAGTAITFMDLSPVLVITATLGVGIVMLFAMKMISVSELKKDILNLKNKLHQPIEIKKKKSKNIDNDTPEKKNVKEKQVQKSKDKGKGSFFASFSSKISGILPKKNTVTKDGSSGKENQESTKKSGKNSLFSHIPSLKGIFGRKKAVEKKTKKIDDLVDKTIKGEFPLQDNNQDEDTAKKAGQNQGKNNDNKNRNISDDQINDDDLSDLDSLDLGLDEEEVSETESPEKVNFEEEIPESTIAEILANEGIELEMDDEEFPNVENSSSDEEDSKNDTALSTDELDELNEDISGLDLDNGELEEFDDIDLDELDVETDEEIELDEEEPADEVEIGDSGIEDDETVKETPEEDDIFSSPPKEWTQTKTFGGLDSGENIFEEPMSLSMGGNVDEDDLFAMLKSDTKKAVSVQEFSLVRDLKDAKIESEELVEDLENILEKFGVQKEIKSEKTKLTDKTDINKNNS
ncbi:hypothetical protein J2128_000903 [Methanomicrobium sp. W14]|uniref:hypothetical protein n=1 Tax=Methanomicrobium sp. W14 TaxID=2817839 RepID=UPI001AE5D84B|nr:hypothetical protein [Methanomicrobium sp. W14]MBP2132982.1 hypothetical protein [Methanomicrobium sp. W14]